MQRTYVTEEYETLTKYFDGWWWRNVGYDSNHDARYYCENDCAAPLPQELIDKIAEFELHP